MRSIFSTFLPGLPSAGLGLLLFFSSCQTEELGSPERTEPMTLTIAISNDMPPYVVDGATSGIEVDIMRRAFPERHFDFIQMPYGELQTAVPAGRAEVALGVKAFSDDGVFYSRDFVRFRNVAVTKKSAGLRINSVADLAGHRVLTWQDAYLELGPEFKRLFSPGSRERQNYIEVAEQGDQVRMFWQADRDVIVIDRNIFLTFTRESGHSPSDVVFHTLFPPVTDFRAGFGEETLRDAFDDALTRLCENGDYAQILGNYEVEITGSICSQ